MRKAFFLGMLMILAACGKKFQPEIKGWRAFYLPARTTIRMDVNGRKSSIVLPSGEGISYRSLQWTREGQILLVQATRRERCTDFQLLAIDTAGHILDTVYAAPPGMAVNFKLAPNDTLILLKTYEDCIDGDYAYTFYDRYSRKMLADTVFVGNARGIPLYETVWSPDSRKVIVLTWWGNFEDAFVYDRVTKDTTYIDRGINFIWSPADKNVVGFIKDYSIYTKNLETGEVECIYKGRRKKSVVRFRWDPTGKFMMVYIRKFFLNIEAPPTTNTALIYLNMEDGSESKSTFGEIRLDTWRGDK